MFYILREYTTLYVFRNFKRLYKILVYISCQKVLPLARNVHEDVLQPFEVVLKFNICG